MGFVNDKKMNAKQIAAMMAAMNFAPGMLDVPTEPPKQSDKPEFTPEELELIRSLPKAEKKRKVAELKAKYAKGGK